MEIREISQTADRHPIYWFDDGSLIVKVSSNQENDTMLFRIHACLLRRHSRCVLEPKSEDGWDIPIITLPPALGVQVRDFISLLAHLYHDTPLSSEAPFQHVAAILRATSPEQLDLPSVHSLARSYFAAMFPSGPSPFVHPTHIEEALRLVQQYSITTIQKGIYYSLVTTTDFESDSDAAQLEGQQDENPSKTTALAPTDVNRCQKLMNGIVAHFTPVLFEPPVLPHMTCSSLMGEKWFPLVVQHAIAEGSVYKPLEALERLKHIDWAAEGLCEACVRLKKEEWTSAQEEVWAKMDEWLGLDVPLVGSST